MIEILQQIINGMAIGGVYVLIALGLTTVFGILGIAHFAHGSVSMFGGYLTFFFVVTWGLPLIAAIVIALLVGLILGILIELLAYRPVRNANHINAFIVALGLTMMVEGLNLEFFGHEQVVIPTDFSWVFKIGGVTIPELRLYTILAAALLIAAMTIFVEKTKTGQAIRAVAENRDAAILMGVNVNTIPLVVFSISTALGVCAGVMVGALFAIAPGIGEGLVVKGFAVLILGGLGSIPGAVVGGLVDGGPARPGSVPHGGRNRPDGRNDPKGIRRAGPQLCNACGGLRDLGGGGLRVRHVFGQYPECGCALV